MSTFWYVIALTGYFGLFSVLLLWFAWLEPVQRIPVALVLLLLVAPLLFPLRGLLHGRRYTHAWSSFMALFYFTVGVFGASGAMERPWLAWLSITFSLLFFLGTILYVRSHAREQRQAQALKTESGAPIEPPPQ